MICGVGMNVGKNIFFCALVLLNINICFSKQINNSTFEFVNFKNNKSVQNYGPAVLLVRFYQVESGVQHHVLSLYKGLLEKGFNIHLAVLNGTSLQARLVDEKLSHYSIFCRDNISEKEKFNLFYSATHQICIDRKIEIIHTNGALLEFEVAKSVANALDLKVIQQHHSYRVPDAKYYNGSNALILASPSVADLLSKKINRNKGVKYIKFMPPLCDDDKFLNFVPSLSKELFFESVFGTNLSGFPILLMVANFYECKNHEGLLYALQKLIYEYKLPVECFLAGADSKSREIILKNLCSELGLTKYVHFLGFVSDIPSLMFYSDIVILPSNGDAFPITILEAAFMQKAIILSQNAGSAGLVIKNKETGLLCDPKSPENIALQIKEIVKSVELKNMLATAAFEHVMKNFSKKCVLELYIDFYKEL